MSLQHAQVLGITPSCTQFRANMDIQIRTHKPAYVPSWDCRTAPIIQVCQKIGVNFNTIWPNWKVA